MIQKTLILIMLLTLLTPITASADENEIRMRVMANSDTVQDQSEKEALYQAIQIELLELFKSRTFTRKELTEQLYTNLPHIQRIAEEKAEILAPGQNISTAFEPHTFPDGKTVQTLVIKIGSGAGENWWCAFFPEMCRTVTLDEEENSDCGNDLSPEKQVSKSEIKVESFIVNWISEKWNRFNEKRG